MNAPLTGLVAAVFTPLKPNREIDLVQIEKFTDYLADGPVTGIYILGGTGEGVSFSNDERRAVAEAFVRASDGRLKTIVQVGHNSLPDARSLAEHAELLGVDAISATPPSYFKPGDVDMLVNCLSEVTAGALKTPFYYYNIPAVSGVDLSMIEFLKEASSRLPTLAGIKYSKADLAEFKSCLNYDNGRFDIPWGTDEMLLGGLATGATSAVGTTYCYAAPLYQAIIDAVNEGDLAEAQRLQGLSVEMINITIKHGGRGGLKASMKLVGVDCGPQRYPIRDMCEDGLKAMRKDFERAGILSYLKPVG